MTGDSIHIISNTKTEQLDSLKVLENAFIVSLDSISKTGYNQAKGVNLYGKFKENELRIIDLVKIGSNGIRPRTTIFFSSANFSIASACSGFRSNLFTQTIAGTLK